MFQHRHNGLLQLQTCRKGNGNMSTSSQWHAPPTDGRKGFETLQKLIEHAYCSIVTVACCNYRLAEKVLKTLQQTPLNTHISISPQWPAAATDLQNRN